MSRSWPGPANGVRWRIFSPSTVADFFSALRVAAGAERRAVDGTGDATEVATEMDRAMGLTAAQGTVRTEVLGAHLGTARCMRGDG